MRLADLSGMGFGKLVAKRFAHSKSGNAYWVCDCECGGKATVSACHLKSGHTQSCGCHHKNVTSLTKSTHRESAYTGNSKEYRAWSAMKSRCNNKAYVLYHRYGGRGITVCQDWLDSFEVFLKDMGRAPSKTHSLDRINNDGGYSKDNCKWSTPKEQANNRGGRFDKKVS